MMTILRSTKRLSPCRRRLHRQVSPSGFSQDGSRLRPRLEVMEDRTLLSTFVVSNTDDSGPGSLRQAILDANAQGGAETITFDPTAFATPQTITLTSGQLELSDTSRDRDDHGPGGGRDGQRRRDQPGVPGRHGCHGVDLGTDDHRRHRHRQQAAACTTYGTTTLTNCTISGNSASNGGGVDLRHRLSAARLTLTDCTVSGNTAGGTAAASALGGTTTLTNCTVSGNTSVGNGGGLGVYSGTTSLTNCTLYGNSAGLDYGGGL